MASSKVRVWGSSVVVEVFRPNMRLEGLKIDTPRCGGRGNQLYHTHARTWRVATVSARQGARNIPRRGYRSPPRYGKDQSLSDVRL